MSPLDIETQIRLAIADVLHLSLGTSHNNKPWVCEVHFAYDESLHIYYRSLRTRRHSIEIADNPCVSGTIIHQHSISEPPVGVYFEGTAALIGDASEKASIADILKARLHVPDTILEDSNDPEGHQFYKISVATFYLFDAFNNQKTQKYTLPWSSR